MPGVVQNSNEMFYHEQERGKKIHLDISELVITLLPLLNRLFSQRRIIPQ